MVKTESKQPFALTWAATSPLSFEQDPIAEIWAPEGKWPVTPAAKRPEKTATWFLESAAYPGFEETAADIAARIREGTWLMVAGVPAPSLDRWQPHCLTSGNFIDAPNRLFVIDFHGLTPDAGEDISKPECFGQPIVDTLRARFAAAGVNSMARAKVVLVATPSTGAKHNSRGAPAMGCACFCALFELDVPVPIKRHGVLLYVRDRTREHIQTEEESAERFFSRLPKSEQVGMMQEIIVDLWRLLRRRDADSFGASVRPGDLYSGVHLRDFLQPISTAPHFWRLITLEGLACGALLFEKNDDVAIVLPNALWDGDFNNRTSASDTQAEICACLRVMAEPYPPTLPDPERWGGSQS